MSQLSGKFIQNLTIALGKLNQSGAVVGQLIQWSGASWVPFTRDYLVSTNAVQSVATTTYTTITQLISATLPVGTYKWSLFAIAQSTATAVGFGFKIVSVTSTIGLVQGQWEITAGPDGTSKYYGYDQLSTADNLFATTAVAANADSTGVGEGILRFSINDRGSQGIC